MQCDERRNADVDAMRSTQCGCRRSAGVDTALSLLSSDAPPRPPATGNGMRAIVPIYCMTRIVAGGNAYWHRRGVEGDEDDEQRRGPVQR
jgi:hypothetical protein